MRAVLVAVHLKCMDGLDGRVGFEYIEHAVDWSTATPFLSVGAVLAFACSVIYARTAKRPARIVGIVLLAAGVAVSSSGVMNVELANSAARDQWHEVWSAQIEHVTGQTVDPIALYRLPGAAPSATGVFMSDVPLRDESGSTGLADLIWNGRLVTVVPAD